MTAAEYLLLVFGGERRVPAPSHRGAEASRALVLKADPDPIGALAGLASPWIIVRQLRLESSKACWSRPVAVHGGHLYILTAEEDVSDGRLLVIRRGGQAPSVDIQLADNWLLSDLGEHGDRTIYKIVGSPFTTNWLIAGLVSIPW